MADLDERYQAQLSEICAALERGEPPWHNAVARQGPCLLGRSGHALRGLAAVIAWHGGASWARAPLAWRLVSPDDAAPHAAPVLPLPGHGGERLYAAVPDPRPQPLQGAPRTWDATEVSGAAAALHDVLAVLGTLRPDLSGDLRAVVSLAHALVRPLGGHPVEAEGALAEVCAVASDEAWTLSRLARVCAWGQWVADVARFGGSKSGSVRALRSPASAQALPGASERDDELEVIASGLLQHGPLLGALPAELRSAQGAGEPAERPVNLALFHASSRERTQAFSELGAPVWTARGEPVWPALALMGGVPLSDDFSAIRAAVQWPHHAAVGLALAERLCGDQLLPSEPGVAWRRVGAVLRDASNAKRDWVGALLAPDDDQQAGARAWARFRRQHHLSTWVHRADRLCVGQLAAASRFEGDALVDAAAALLHMEREDARTVPVRSLPVVLVASHRRSRQEVVTDEVTTLAAVATALGCARDWPSVLKAHVDALWARQARPKASGGVRWLDVPPPPLRAALQRVGAVLAARSPRSSVITAFHAGASPALHARAHEGAVAAVRVDVADFFGSVRPWHLAPWLGLAGAGGDDRFADWSEEGRRALLRLLFYERGGRTYLPQGAPTSPAAANLAATFLDRAIVRAAVERFGAGLFRYTRYADDLVLSTADERVASDFDARAILLLEQAVQEQGWRVQPSKTSRWSAEAREPFYVCGLRVPGHRDGPVELDKGTARRARAALHRLRTRRDYQRGCDTSPNEAHGLLAYAYEATGDPLWLAYTSRHVLSLARTLGGPVFSEAFLAGWSDPPVAPRAAEE